MSSKQFENVKGQIGRCGIWCGSCVVGNGALAEFTRRCERLMETYGLRDWGPKDFDYDEFIRGLRSIQGIAPCSGCLKGGGRDECEIRSCVEGRELLDCGDCGDFKSCFHAAQLEKMRSGAVRAGLFVRDPGEERAEALRRWNAELPLHWPQSVLFDEQMDQW
jgi:hypothetical protein